MSNEDISAMPSTTTHGEPEVLDDGDTARIVEGEGAGHLVPGGDVLDEGETARVVEGEGVAADVFHDGDDVLDEGETAGVVEADGPPKGP
ncbi:MAG: hypothetical protein AAGC49_04535 [Brevundimonas sp.]